MLVESSEVARDVDGSDRDEDKLDFDAFYHAEYAPAVRLAFAFTGRRDVAEEQVQEAFLAAYRRWHTLCRYDSPPAWLRRAVMNRCVSVARRRFTEVRLLARLRRERPISPELPQPAEELLDALRSLPKRQAQVLALLIVEDRSVSEIAKILGCGEATVRTHLHRGRRRLAERLGEVDTREEQP